MVFEAKLQGFVQVRTFFMSSGTLCSGRQQAKQVTANQFLSMVLESVYAEENCGIKDQKNAQIICQTLQKQLVC
jgi:hypothetical protein